MRGNYSVKSDAFSFGVMVLEIMTGRKNNDCYNSQQSEDLLTTVCACLLACSASEYASRCDDAVWLMGAANGTDLGALEGRDSVGYDGPLPEQQLLGKRSVEVHACRASMCPGEPGRPAGDVVGGHDARKRNRLSQRPVEAFVVRKE